MYDPMTVAWKIKYPWYEYKPWPKKKRMIVGRYDDCWNNLTDKEKRGRSRDWNTGYRNTFLTIWHKDPERDGTDDSCGWFKRSRHGDPITLKRIESRFSHEWDTYYETSKGQPNPVGWFFKDGSPRLPISNIVLQMFNTAAWEYFEYNRRKTDKFLKRELLDILLFSANNTDSLFDSITRKYEILCGEEQKREYRIQHFASVIYSWILRSETKWYQHPRLHIHHWKFQLHPWQNLKRRYWDKCSNVVKEDSLQE